MKRVITEEDIIKANDLERIRILIAIIEGDTVYKNGGKKMKKFKIIDMRVKEILEKFPTTRNNDHALYTTYIETYYSIDFTKNAFEHYKDYNIPPYSSIERSARDIKRKNENLKGTANTQDNRKYAEAEYREYYK